MLINSFTRVITDIVQGAKGIRQWAINWCISPMMIHKITRSVD